MIPIRSVWLQVRKHCYLSMCAFMVCIGVFYLACATLITVIPHYQQQIAKEFSNLLGEPLDFSRIKFTWRGFRVYARVYNVDIGNHNDKIHIDNINKIQFLLHPVKSLFKLKPVIDDITVNGGKIYLKYGKQETQSDFSPEQISYYLKQVFNHGYLDWININQVNLKNTAVIVYNENHVNTADISKPAQTEEYLVSEVNIYNAAKYNYLHGLVYHVNKAHDKNKEREIIEIALKHTKVKSSVNGDNRFYLATNSKGLEHILNDLTQTKTATKIVDFDLDPNTWLKVWGNFDFTKQFQIQLDSPRISIKDKTNKTVDVTNINGIFDFSINTDQNYNLSISKLNAEFAGSPISMMGNIHKPSAVEPAVINSHIEFGHTNLKKFFAELPAIVVGQETSDWLKRHITRGWLGHSEIIWRGNLDKSFPYDKKYDSPNGIFQLRAEILNTDIDYDSGVWPAVEHLNGILSLRGRDISIASTSAQISQSNVKDIRAEVKGLGKVKHLDLLIEGNLATGGADLHHIIKTSPLSKKLGGLNKSTEFLGDIDLAIKLDIPLSHAKPVKISGGLDFKQNDLEIKNTPLKFTDLVGNIKFTDTTVSSTNLQAKLNDRTAKFTVSNKGNGRGTYVTLNSWAEAKFLLDYYKVNLGEDIKGVTEFDLALNIKNIKHDQEELSVKIGSSLIGIESKLPFPYNKESKETRVFKFNIVHDFADFTEYRVTVHEAKTAGITRLVWNKNKQDSSLLIDTKNAFGKLFFIEGTDKIFADFDYIKLPESVINDEKDSALSKLDYLKSPKLSGTVSQLYLGQHMLGKIDFSVSPDQQNKLLAINSLTVTGALVDLKLRGQYLKNSQLEQTSVHGTYNIKDIGKIWQIFSASKFNEKIRLKGTYNLTWNGDLLSPELASLNGNLSINSGYGRINGIEPGLGRVFSLLDLAAINKRLRLDFSDVFENGYKFDAAKGKFKIADGVLTTKKTLLQAGTADIEIYGDVDLGKKSYNLMADVTPHLTSGLPIAAAVIGTPIAGAAVFLLDKLLEYPVNQLSERAYSISGPWADPKVKSVGSNKRGPLIELSWFNQGEKT